MFKHYRGRKRDRLLLLYGKAIKDYLQATLKQMLVKAYYSVELVKRYYVLMRRAFKIVIKELLKALKEDRLQMAIKAINDTAGLNGLVFTFLVFGTLPKLTEQDRLAAFT
ncbi:hypothetical protein MBM_08717 [Drepanopeziza brunnea f. sp. 'multigermtubi' MB_m1]|uniref:Uncharacterized protein n=1 Tax=Marssonina brunnea f. sp. multigermtubi (strain MB_m1) TaxID=1072389 RepID=K1XLE5_MARBU|nr:uncharacterized protein MBM_08717 [Drepanopeziza brunnea f. sp. 'multigermtubi' MB_m1]EKD13274.1 hypothetical protein MBM_08717 [Drepanopeziza brunnea f. sp. 'multigermtubi' MB_m1]